MSFPVAWIAFWSGGGGTIKKSKHKLKSGQEKYMPLLEDNTFAIKSVCFMEIYDVHQVKSSVDFF